MPRRRISKPSPRRLKADKSFSRKCGRTAFTSKVDATIALGHIPDGKTIRKCPDCHRYHVVEQGETLESRNARHRNASGRN